jgi:glycosyl transferase family 25
MRAYYINLARRPERRETMERRFSELGIVFERIEATTPADITHEQRARFCDPTAYRWQTEGELACSLSHQAAMRQFLTTGTPFAAVFEDDAILSPSLPALLAEVDREGLPIDLLRLETDNGRLRLPPRPDGKIGVFAVFRLHSAGGGAAGYIVSRHGAERILAGDEILRDLTDQALFNPYASLSRQLVMRQLDPALVVQEDRAGGTDGTRAGSDLEPMRRYRGKTDGRNFWQRARYNFYDLVQRDVIAALRNLWLSKARGVRKRAIIFKTD